MKNWCIYHPKDKEVIEYLRKLKSNYKWECNYSGYYYINSKGLLEYNGNRAGQPKGYILLTEQEFKEQIMNKKELPKYFVIHINKSNPLWFKYIDWLNKTYKVNYGGDCYTYYGFDGFDICNNGTKSSNFLEDFKHNPTLLTLEEWDSIVNPKQEFVLPEKWHVKVTKENQEILTKWKNDISKGVFNHSAIMYNYITYDGSGDDGRNLKGYTEITFEQFKQYVIKEKMYTIEQIKEQKIAVKINSIKEYKILSQNFETIENCNLDYEDFKTFCWYAHVSNKGLRYNSSSWVGLSEYKIIEFNQVIFENMKQEEIVGYEVPYNLFDDKVLKGDLFIKHQLGCKGYVPKNRQLNEYILPKEIVETWEPVYKTKEQTYTLSNGKEVTITKDYVVCAGESVKIEKFKELAQITSKLNNTFHTWSLSLTEATFKIGCWEDVKLSDIQQIIKIYESL